jgi:ribosomal protein S18 acetylase RimI-like enzyme
MPPKLTYFKRFRMERSLAPPPGVPPLPAGFHLVPWADTRLDLHADILFRSFADDLDGRVFANLSSVVGCHHLMRAVRVMRGFCPAACWLVAGPEGYAGAIQGVIDSTGHGAIQNLGVTPDSRGLGLAAALLARSMVGFHTVGARWCHLEVTADNTPAVRLYRRFEFRKTRVTYLPVAVPAVEPVGVGI